MQDSPGNYLCLIRYFEVMTELVNGPCPFNQRLVYRYRTDMYMGLIKRTIDDVDSIFYQLKDTVINYVMSLIEGEGIFPL